MSTIFNDKRAFFKHFVQFAKLNRSLFCKSQVFSLQISIIN